MLAGLAGLATPLLRALDPERAHGLAVAALRCLPVQPLPAHEPRLAVAAFGLKFPAPLGLAAGFDKHAEAIDGALSLGFGFVEVGGVTPQPQPGNARPRVFRLPNDGAIINRYGLNSAGVEQVAARLAARQGRPGLVGVNLGANKETVDRAADYAVLAGRLAPLADFLTINVSSPNTAGLRDLQALAALDDLVARTVAARDAACLATGRQTPLLVKIAPDLTLAELDDIITVARQRSLDGLVVANTTVARPDTLLDRANAGESGGLSGRPLFAPSTALLAAAFLRVERAFPLIGVGGIDSPETAWTKIEAGATLLQLYTGMIYQGPGLIGRIHDGISARLAAENLTTLAPVVGRRAAELAVRPS